MEPSNTRKLTFLSTLSLRRATDHFRRHNGENIFLSTLSLRRATPHYYKQTAYFFYFYPRSPCGERHAKIWNSTERPVISIHALLAESDVIITIITICIASFLSTLSLRRATALRASRQHPAGISIHALLAESDAQTARNTSIAGHFYPRSPCGERPLLTLCRFLLCRFLSTLSLRRATVDYYALQYVLAYISIHALLAESDDDLEPSNTRKLTFLSTLSLRRATTVMYNIVFVPGFLSTLSLRRATLINGISLIKHVNFYPRSPCGERLWPGLLARPFLLISIHALLAESDTFSRFLICGSNNFYPRSPCGERHDAKHQTYQLNEFLSTLSLRRATALIHSKHS